MIWSGPCPVVQVYAPVAWGSTDMIEYVDGQRYECRWTCGACGGVHGFELPVEGARYALMRGARHVVVYLVEPEAHRGGAPITEDDQIDFHFALNGGADEAPDAVHDRIWQELEAVRREVREETS